jgi:pyruvate ferredoxin oxidoreductase beta subunit
MAIKDLPREEFVLPGNAACPGCPSTMGLRTVLKALGKNTILTIPACCTSVIESLYPYTSFNIPLLNIAFEAAGASASGISAALKKMGKEKINVLVWAGDGGAYDIGLQSLSGAIERKTNFIYICYNNEMYSNTGIQRSGATPYGAWTTTTWTGKKEHRKDLMEIVIAHHPPYAATACVSYPEDLFKKVTKAKSIRGSKFIELLCPCPVGWRFDMSKTVEIGRLAVETGSWVLYEYERGKINFNPPSNLILDNKKEPKPIEDYLKMQGRFRHLFKPKRDEERLKEMKRYLAKRLEYYRKLKH